MDISPAQSSPPARKRVGIGGHHSPAPERDEWLTPPDVLRALGPFDLDPCAPVRRPWEMATKHYTHLDNGLLRPWVGRVWCNPPYGRETGRWLGRCAEHGNVTALIFARTETSDWINHVWGRADAVLFLFGRLFFYDTEGKRAKSNAGAPSALVSYDEGNTEILRSCGLAGRLVSLRAREGVGSEGWREGEAFAYAGASGGVIK